MMTHPQGVLGIFPSFGPGLTGGIETSAEVAWQAVERFADARNDAAHLLCYGRSPDRADLFRNTRFRSSKAGAFRAACTTPVRPKTILVWHLGLLKLIPPLLRFRPQILLFLHGIEAWRRQDVLTRFLLRYVDTFLSNSTYTWERFLRYEPHLTQRPHIVLPLGLGTQSDTPPIRPDSTPIMLMLSRLSTREDYKGHKEIIGAWNSVLERIPDAKLLIAGEGDLRPVLEQLVMTKGLTKSVKLLGYISEDTKHELITRCRCLAMPSRNEGFGLVYLEAMRLGRPCLVSMEDAGREVVNPPEAGLAVDVNNTANLVAKICRLLASGSEWEEWSRAARSRYECSYTRNHFQDRLYGVLEQTR